MNPLAILKFLWSIKELVLLGVVLAIGTGYIWHYKHLKKEVAKLETKLVKEQKEHNQLKTNFALEAKKWQDQVLRRTQENEEAAKKKAEIVKKNRKQFNEIFEKVEIHHNKVDNETKQIPATDTVTLPSYVRMQYDTAVEGSRIALGLEVDKRISEDRPKPETKTETFDASAFTEVLIKNVKQYNELALQCNKLIDVVEELEVRNGTDAGGISRAANEVRRDIPSRVVESIF